MIHDPDFVGGDGGECWWTFRCLKCGETFQTAEEYLHDT